MYLEVVLNVPVPGTFTYKLPTSLLNEFQEQNSALSFIGFRVEVQFGKRKMQGYVINEYLSIPTNISCSEDKIKEVQKIIDKQPLFTKEQVELAFWISKYYLCSEGEALSAMIPSGKRGTAVPSFGFEDDPTSYTKHILSDEQKCAIKNILSPDAKSNLHYLYGQTGSGKTEVFLSVAEEVLSKGKGVIYLVPEIGLTHQVIESVVARFGKTAAILHSGLTGSQKLTEWNRILSKEARVVIGARSAVFAPIPDLGLIIIDEEHDGSYKSGNTPRYHSRQVAMKRCSTKKIPLLMGSATPSVEAWQLMEENKIEKHVLTQRLSGGKLPEIEIINLSKEKMTGCISNTLAEEIRKTKAENRQTILFLNRRGFTHFFRCNSCGYELKCKNCSVSLTYHKSENRLRCHYCGWSVSVPSICPECGSLDVGYSGFGTEFIEEEVKAKFPNCSVDRVDTDILTKKDALQEKLQNFKSGKTDILLGTQMVAKGLNFPGLKLVGVILADTGLNLPDFRAAERTFSLIVQVAGRAGRFFPDGKVLVQSYSPDRPAIALACKNDITGFYKQEIEQRQMMMFPPFSRLLRIVFRSAKQNVAEEAANSAFSIISKMVSDDIEVLGPSECPLFMIAANYRYQILLRSLSITKIQLIVSKFIHDYKTPFGIYTEIDTDPIHLL